MIVVGRPERHKQKKLIIRVKGMQSFNKRKRQEGDRKMKAEKDLKDKDRY